jgi:hypothetical protein
MKTFKIHFTRNKQGAIFSKLLQWYEGIPVSHVSIEFDTPHLNQNFIYHSVIGSGVSFISITRFLNKNEIMESYEVSLDDETYNLMRNNLLDNCGEHYGMLQNIGIFIVDKLKRLGIKSTNPFKDGQNCSELVYRDVIPYICKNYSGYSPDLIKPSQIRNILKKNGINPIFSII